MKRRRSKCSFAAVFYLLGNYQMINNESNIAKEPSSSMSMPIHDKTVSIVLSYLQHSRSYAVNTDRLKCDLRIVSVALINPICSGEVRVNSIFYCGLAKATKQNFISCLRCGFTATMSRSTEQKKRNENERNVEIEKEAVFVVVVLDKECAILRIDRQSLSCLCIH